MFHIDVAAYPEYHPQARSAAGGPDARSSARSTPAPIRPSRSTSTTPTPTGTSSTPAPPRASTCRSCPGSCRSAASRSSPASPTRAAPRSRAGSAASSRATATTRESIRAFGLDVVTRAVRRPARARRARPAFLHAEPGRAHHHDLAAAGVVAPRAAYGAPNYRATVPVAAARTSVCGRRVAFASACRSSRSIRASSALRVVATVIGGSR